MTAHREVPLAIDNPSTYRSEIWSGSTSPWARTNEAAALRSTAVHFKDVLTYPWSLMPLTALPTSQVVALGMIAGTD